MRYGYSFETDPLEDSYDKLYRDVDDTRYVLRALINQVMSPGDVLVIARMEELAASLTEAGEIISQMTARQITLQITPTTSDAKATPKPGTPRLTEHLPKTSNQIIPLRPPHRPRKKYPLSYKEMYQMHLKGHSYRQISDHMQKMAGGERTAPSTIAEIIRRYKRGEIE